MYYRLAKYSNSFDIKAISSQKKIFISQYEQHLYLTFIMGLERKRNGDGMSREYPIVWHLSQVKALVILIPQKEH